MKVRYPKLDFILMTVFIFYACVLNDPEYNLDFDRVQSAPRSLTATPVDLFSIKITWALFDTSLIEKVVIYRGVESSSDRSQQFDFSKYVTITLSDSDQNDGEFYSFLDMNVELGRNYYYYLTSQSGELESLVTDTTSCEFIIEPPSIAVSVDGDLGNIIRQTINLDNYGFDALILTRTSNIDTILNVIEDLPSNGVININDTIQYSLTDTLLEFEGRRLFGYKDIQPNIKYSYQIKGSTQLDTSRRYTQASANSDISITLPTPLVIESAAKSSESVRMYMPDFEMQSYDSAFVYRIEGERTVFDLSYPISALSRFTNLEGETLIFFDMHTSESFLGKVVLWNEFAQSICSNELDSQDTLQFNPLQLGGFNLVEDGYLNPGCVGEDCEAGSYPIPRFYLATFETTNLDIHQWPPEPGEMPIEALSWQVAQDFCQSFSDLVPGYEFSLPSEAEWEYAAKYNVMNATNYSYPWGEFLDIYHANYGNSNDGVVGVGSYPYSSASGQYDMAGNAFEWVMDGYSAEFAPDTTTVYDDNFRMIRGGGYWSGPSNVTTVSREFLPIDASVAGVGFRVKLNFDGVNR